MRVESLDVGASGFVRLRTDGGSRFLFRLRYLDPDIAPLPAAGEELSEAFLSAAAAAAEASVAEAKALELLARAEHTRFLLTQKLRKRGIPDTAVFPALDYLEDSRLLSDERYARSWTEERLRRRGEGPSRLVAGLIARGVREDLARRVTNELLAGSEREEALVRALRRLLRSGREGEDKAVRKLRAEGWKPSELAEALKSFRNGRE